MGNRKQEPSYEQKAEFYRDRKRVRKENRKDPETDNAIEQKTETEKEGTRGRKEEANRRDGREKTETGKRGSIRQRDEQEPRENLTEIGSDRKAAKKDTLHNTYDKIKGLPGRRIVKQNEKLLSDRDVQGAGFLRRHVARAIYVTSTLAIVLCLILAIPCMAVMGFVSLFETPLSITLPFSRG